MIRDQVIRKFVAPRSAPSGQTSSPACSRNGNQGTGESGYWGIDSDRGIQYCSSAYIQLLKEHCIDVSMTENGDPRENAIAERVNGILKDEYLNQYQELTPYQLDDVITKYNEVRPHLSCNMLTPQKAHNLKGTLKRRWKNYYKYRLNQLEKL